MMKCHLNNLNKCFTDILNEKKNYLVGYKKDDNIIINKRTLKKKIYRFVIKYYFYLKLKWH